MLQALKILVKDADGSGAAADTIVVTLSTNVTTANVPAAFEYDGSVKTDADDTQDFNYNNATTGDNTALTTKFTLTGGVGADSLYGAAGADIISGGTGADVLSGFGQADTITGGAGADTIKGGDETALTGVGDNLSGGSGADIIDGNAGDDTIDGGDGADILQVVLVLILLLVDLVLMYLKLIHGQNPVVQISILLLTSQQVLT